MDFRIDTPQLCEHRHQAGGRYSIDPEELALKQVILLIALSWTLIIAVLSTMDYWVLETDHAGLFVYLSRSVLHKSVFGMVWLIGLAGLWLARLRLLEYQSKHTQIETTLRDSERSYRYQFDNNSLVMLLIAPDDGLILEANSAALRFYGYSREQLLALRINDINILPTSEVEQATPSILHDQGDGLLCQHRLADGLTRDVEVSSSIVQFGERVLLHTIYLRHHRPQAG